ncbi:MAG TPA: hypothetical protein VFO77_15935 [Actinoplanes sp.]|nr:hypothetical protein [Actinoplanes sp.]
MTLSHIVVLLLCLPCLVAALIAVDRRDQTRRTGPTGQPGRLGRADKADRSDGRGPETRVLRRLETRVLRLRETSALRRLETHALRWREISALRRLDRRLVKVDVSRVPAPRAGEAIGPSIEQLAADLRRLDRQRHGGIASESVVWSAAVLRAYDQRLRLASRCLGVAEHLEMMEGIDREIERVRVAGQLRAAGLVVCTAAHHPPDLI